MSAKVEDGLLRLLESSAAASECIDVDVSFDVRGVATAPVAGKLVAALNEPHSVASLVDERKAHPSYFKALLDQPGVKGAVLNSGGGSSSSTGRVFGR